MFRFLKGRAFNVKDAKETILEAIEYFAKNRPDLVTEEMISNEIKQEKSFWFGFDKQGHPCLVVKAARHFVSKRDLEEMTKYIQWTIEKGLNLMKSKPGIHKYTVIYDRTNYVRDNFDIDVGQRLMEMAKYAPERISQIFVVKPNWLYHVLFAVIKPFMHPDTMAKIHLTKWDPSEELLQVFEPDQLLVEYGGKAIYEYQYTTPSGKPKMEPELDLEGLTLEETFERVSKKLDQLQLNDEDSNKFYGLKMQATVGDNNTNQPWAVQFEARVKWDSWTSFKGVSKEKAMEECIDLYTNIRNR